MSSFTQLGAGALLLFGTGCGSESLDVVKSSAPLEISGKWYEIAHLSRQTQLGCIGTTATYTRRTDGKFSFVHQCTLKDGTYRGSTATAAIPDLAAPAKMTVDFGGYVGDYWIIDAPADMRYMVVGHPSRDYLWIMSRTPSMAPADLDAAKASASAKQFEVKNLEFTPAGPEPTGTPAPPLAYGCTVHPGSVGGAAQSENALSPAATLAMLGAFAGFAFRRRTSRG